MKETRIPVGTELGIISGRDSIYLDKQEMIEKPFGLIFNGQINGTLCSNNIDNKEWLSFQLSFDYPIHFSCHELDLYDEIKINSSFDIVEESILVANIRKRDLYGKFKDNFSHYIFATYDYIYEIIARDFRFQVKK